MNLALRLLSPALLGAALLLPQPALAQTQATEPWVRATVPAQKATGLFVELRSPNGARLMGASSPAAARVEIHEMKMDGDTMRMRAVDSLNLPAGQAVQLKPGGLHLMLMDLKAPLLAGEQVSVRLEFKGNDGKPEVLELKAPVRGLGFVAGHGDRRASHTAH
ncbi:hypothetical protein HNQ51_003487 [Inhella inkyongensis]|uniref:Copper chaperone PCu(A)C n=1 Tax=Inhella inkyongensis TaxID=392593 RepID=A0A840SBI6_9BURK|nr:copper chaperone PCu(A)C [Inhella inkyongensis]MBB5206144.1 hypothetical protein [Inhella inkyongensis]